MTINTTHIVTFVPLKKYYINVAAPLSERNIRLPSLTAEETLEMAGIRKTEITSTLVGTGPAN